jgi:hypothetical protein
MSGSPASLAISETDSTRSGSSIATSCAMAPPIETPTMWARWMPIASSNPTASSAMSPSV